MHVKQKLIDEHVYSGLKSTSMEEKRKMKFLLCIGGCCGYDAIFSW